MFGATDGEIATRHCRRIRWRRKSGLDPKLDPDVSQTLTELPLVEVRDGFWSRAGAIRERPGDALIAQFCVDHKLSLITRDKDFRAFVDSAELRLLV